MFQSIVEILVSSYLAMLSVHTGTAFDSLAPAISAADSYQCDIESTEKAPGVYGAPYILIDCRK